MECKNCSAPINGRAKRANIYCDNICQQAYQQKQKVLKWLETGEANTNSASNHFVRRYILDEQNHKCAVCSIDEIWQGLPLVFVLDHINGDSTNNARENLRMVCPNCDSQLPTYKSKNKGNGRHSRRVRYAEGKSY